MRTTRSTMPVFSSCKLPVCFFTWPDWCMGGSLVDTVGYTAYLLNRDDGDPSLHKATWCQGCITFRVRDRALVVLKDHEHKYRSCSEREMSCDGMAYVRQVKDTAALAPWDCSRCSTSSARMFLAGRIGKLLNGMNRRPKLTKRPGIAKLKGFEII